MWICLFGSEVANAIIAAIISNLYKIMSVVCISCGVEFESMDESADLCPNCEDPTGAPVLGQDNEIK